MEPTEKLPRFSPPELGHGTIFQKETEENMKIFLADCIALGIPRCKHQFLIDLKFYYEWSTCRNLEKARNKAPVFSKYI